ncbi:MAG: hypothetical protein NC548_55960 [Lachnospiraceae bacterium]|nr:hypothetical protein [Lachnospiraceae bacterium]
MIKKFADFINESQYNTVNSGVYGESLFESITNSFIESINTSINEGRITVEDNIINEGFFTNLFKGASNKATDKALDAGINKEELQKLIGDAKGGKDLIKIGVSIKKEELKEEIWTTVNDLCEDAVKLCEKINQKEEEAKLAITKKFNATKDAIAEFVKKAQATFTKIAETSKNAIVDAIKALRVLLGKLAEISTNALKSIGNGAIISVCLPFVLVYSVYKSVSKLCQTLCEKAKIKWNDIKDTVEYYGLVVADWFKEQLGKIKTTIVEWSKSAKEESTRAVAKAYLYVVGVCGLVVDKANGIKKDVKQAFDSFVDSAKEYSVAVRDYISDRWDKVSTWTKEKTGEFSDGINNVWSAFKDKVNQAVQSTKDAAERLKQFGSDKIADINNWTDDKQQSTIKSILKWAVDKWGEDTVKAWV